MINYIADGVVSNTDDALLNGVPVIKKVILIIDHFYFSCC